MKIVNKSIVFLKSMTKFEKIWLGIFSFLILTSTLVFSFMYTNYSKFSSIALNFIISPLSALTGVLCVVLAAKGHISTWWIGLINSVTYGLVAWISGYYGDWILNWFYFIPTQLIIYYTWKRNLNKETKIVSMKNLNWRTNLLVFILFIGMSYATTLFLVKVDNWFTIAMKRNATIYSYLEQVTNFKYVGPMLDSVSNNLQIFAQLFMILMLSEQWIFWIATNIITITMWTLVVVLDKSSYAYSIPTLIMWLGFMVNSIYGAINWYRNSLRRGK